MTRPLLVSLALACAALTATPFAQAQAASNERPAATTPPNTAPYTPAQAEKPDTSKPVTKSHRQQARDTRNAALAECKTQTERQGRKDCEQSARNAYNKSITP